MRPLSASDLTETAVPYAMVEFFSQGATAKGAISPAGTLEVYDAGEIESGSQLQVACRAEFLVAFRCKGRHFCPSCHARRVAEWSLWLDERLLAPVPHRLVVPTIPKRLRPYFI